MPKLDHQLTLEHPVDVLLAADHFFERGHDLAVAVIVSTQGGSVRAPGALMAVSSTGQSAGYVSGGCVDADLVLQCLAALRSRTGRKIVYGAGSPFMDLQLPCGGAIEIQICVNPERSIIRQIVQTLTRRSGIHVGITADGEISLHPGDRTAFVAYYAPKPKLRIAGRGADCLALAKLAATSGFSVSLWLRKQDQFGLEDLNEVEIVDLASPDALPLLDDDPWTAFTLMFHDGDWEIPLLAQALQGPAFFIGAVGSQRTHHKRCEALRASGCSDLNMNRIYGPVGLIPSMRDASTLAISTLAQIIDQFRKNAGQPDGQTGYLLLAAGTSSRFAGKDKLTAPLHGLPVLRHTAKLADGVSGRCVAVTGPLQVQRNAILAAAGWIVMENKDAASGQSSSLRLGLDALMQDPRIRRVMILLGDMPYIDSSHIAALHSAMMPGVAAVMSVAEEVRMPPALFDRTAFEALLDVTGDRGARTVFDQLEKTAFVNLAPTQAMDIDTLQDLETAQEVFCD